MPTASEKTRHMWRMATGLDVIVHTGGQLCILVDQVRLIGKQRETYLNGQ